MRRTHRLLLLVLVLVVGSPVFAQGGQIDERDAFGPFLEEEASQPRHALRRPSDDGVTTSWVRHWNGIAIDAAGLDHTPVGAGEVRVFGEQLGPGRSSRAMAMVHIAVFEAVNSIAGGFESYVGLPRAPRGASMKAAIAVSAFGTLVSLYPSQAATFRAALVADLARLRLDRALLDGIVVGYRAVQAVHALRGDDGSAHAEPLVDVEWPTSDAPGRWRQDPISQIPLALGAYWGEVEPFVIDAATAFRVPPPPALESAAYADAFDEVVRLGGDGVVTPTERTDQESFIGTFWAYDGTPSLCAPPRLYNQIAVTIADQQGLGVVALARLLALVNVAMADAGIAAWESKYHYDFWRPITGVREADPGTGPTGLGDGNPDTIGDPSFTPLGAPPSNLSGVPDFTPPFPAYPSGHAAFGGALFQTLRNFFGTDDIAFTFVSDEWNGETVDVDGNVRPLVPRHFSSFSEAEEENGQSRIYLGIHWSFDKTEGIAQGRRVADHVFAHVFRPRS